MSMALLMTIAVLLAGGMGVALLGSVKVALARKLQMSEARVGGMVSVFGLATIPVFPSVGFVTDLVGKQPVVIGGCFLMTASLIVLGSARKYRSALVGVLLFSAAWASLINVVNPLSVIVFGKPEVFATNLACFIFGIGAFATPLAVAWLLQRVSLTRALLLLGVFALLPAALVPAVDFSALAPPAAEQEAAGEAAAGMATLLKDPVMWLLILAFLFYGPLEAATGAWTTTYLGDSGVSEKATSSLLSAFWATYTVSRLITALTVYFAELPAQGQRALILAFGLASVVVLSGIVRVRGRGAAIGMVIAAGVAFGPIFPTIMGVLMGHFPKSVHGRAVGLLFAIGGIGTATIPAAMGAYAKRTSVQRGFLIAVGAAAALSAVALILVAWR